MMSKINWGVMMILSVLLYSCYPKGAETLNDTNLVLTDYDDNFNFTSEKTYYLRPDVVYVDTTATEDPQLNSTIISEVRSQFAALGWTEADTITDPSEVTMVVMTSVLSTSITQVTYWPGYGGWYGGWWGYPCCGYYYPTSYTYNIGTIFIDAFDGSSHVPGSDLYPPIVWTAIMNGVLGNTVSSVSTTRVKTVIDQAFVQSPYLK